MKAVKTQLRNEKSILAKLMSTENIEVRHTKVPTAMFDNHKRVLYLPIWKEMNNEVYDLFVCHEVGHALYTPSEGWHNAICEEGEAFKGYLNIIEDVRIERKIKLKYPGARAQMYKGYKVLVHELDFFGLNKHQLDVNEMNFIDRINVHYKSGASEGVEFKENEEYIIDRLDNIEDWDEVVEIANLIFDQDKETMEQQQSQSDEDDQDSYDDFNIPMTGQQAADWDDEEDSIENHKDQTECQFNVQELEEEKEWNDDYQDSSEMNAGAGAEQQPTSITDEEYRMREEDLVEEDSDVVLYGNIPDANLKESIIGWKEVLKASKVDIDKFTDEGRNQDAMESLSAYVTVLKHENNSIINYMVKEFEMKKRAAEYKRERLSNSGTIDMNKLHNYKLTDSIFKRITILPEGKNHGLVMYVDYSGSMNNCIVDTIKQTYVLVEFCRRANIPYRVFTFCDYNTRGAMNDNINANDENASKFYNFKEGDLHVMSGNIYLTEWFNEKMSAAQHKQMTMNFFAYVLRNHPDLGYYSGAKVNEFEEKLSKQQYNAIQKFRWFPRTFGNLWGTPLNDCIFHGMKYAEEFKRSQGIEHLHSVFLTDGDSSGRASWVDSQGQQHHLQKQLLNVPGMSEEYNSNYRLMVKDPKNKSTFYGGKGSGFIFTNGLLKAYKHRVGGSLIGFYLTPSKIPYRMFSPTLMSGKKKLTTYEAKGIENQLKKDFRKNKYLVNTRTAFDKLFLLKTTTLQYNENKLDVEEDASQRKLVSAFKKMRSKKLIQRPILNQFVELVA